MKPEEFCYWLQGSIELNDNCEFDENQTEIVKRHLAMVFEHIAHLDEKDQPVVAIKDPTLYPYTLERC